MTDLGDPLGKSIRFLPLPLMKALYSCVGISPSSGALTSIFASASPTVAASPALYKGAYLIPYGKLAEASKLGCDEALAKELWETSEKIVKDVLEKE